MMEAEIVQAIRDEMKPHGRPVAKYEELQAETTIVDPVLGERITVEMILNLEDRIVGLEGTRR